MAQKSTPADSQNETVVLGYLMARLSDVTHHTLSRVLDPFQLTLPQYALLITLHRQQTDCTMSALAEATYQVSATITGIVDRLEERALVERKRDPDDRRVWRVSLTEAGKDLLRAVEHQREAHWLQVWSQFEPADRLTMLRLMQHYLEVTESSAHQEA